MRMQELIANVIWRDAESMQRYPMFFVVANELSWSLCLYLRRMSQNQRFCLCALQSLRSQTITFLLEPNLWRTKLRIKYDPKNSANEYVLRVFCQRARQNEVRFECSAKIIIIRSKDVILLLQSPRRVQIYCVRQALVALPPHLRASRVVWLKVFVWFRRSRATSATACACPWYLLFDAAKRTRHSQSSSAGAAVVVVAAVVIPLLDIVYAQHVNTFNGKSLKMQSQLCMRFHLIFKIASA